MNRTFFQSAANDWTRMVKNDIRNKVKGFMDETETTTSELAYVLGISEGELDQIINGNCEITISTIVKLLIATGNAIEIKPIRATPIGDYSNLHRGGLPPHMPFFNEPTPSVRTQRRNIFDEARQRQALHNVLNFEGDDDELDENEFTAPTTRRQPRDSHGRFQSFRNEPTTHSKFDAMTRPKLVDIIKTHLWDSEIDTVRATKEELVKFLDEKDNKIKAIKDARERENDPSVNEFRNKLKDSVRKNPNLRKFLENLINED